MALVILYLEIRLQQVAYFLLNVTAKYDTGVYDLGGTLPHAALPICSDLPK